MFYLSMVCFVYLHLVESVKSTEEDAQLHVNENNEDLKEVTEIIEKTEISKGTEPRKSTELTKLEKSEVLEKLASVFAWDDSEDSEREDKDELIMKRKQVKEKTIVKSKAKKDDVDFDFDQFDKDHKGGSVDQDEVVKELVKKIESSKADKVQQEPEITLELAKIDKESKEDPLTERENDKGKDDEGHTEVTREIFTEGGTKVIQKTVTHQSHTATVVKGQPKITQTITVVREMSAPEVYDAITTSGESRHAEIQQYTTTVSGNEDQEKIIKTKQLEIEGKAKEKEEEIEAPSEKIKETIFKEIHTAEAEKSSTALEDKAVGPAGDAGMISKRETIQSIEEEAYAIIKKRTGIDFSAGGDAVEIEDDDSEEEEEEEEAVVVVKPELIPWSKEAPKEVNGTSEIQYVSDKTIRTEEMQLLDEVTVETKVMEVKTIKMELSHLGDVSVEETTEIKTDTDMSENRQRKEREETIYLHTKADKKQLKDRASPLAITDKSGSDVESKDSKRERIPVLPKGAKLSDDWTPVHSQRSNKFSDWRDSKVQAAEAQRKSPSVTKESYESDSQELHEPQAKNIEEDIVKAEDVKQEHATPKNTDKEPVKHTEIVHDPDDLDEGETYFCVAISTYDPESDEVLSLHEGEKVEVLDDTQDDWWLVRKSFSLREGWVPGQYLREKAVYDKIVERQLKKAIEQLPSSTSKIPLFCTKL